MGGLACTPVWLTSLLLGAEREQRLKSHLRASSLRIASLHPIAALLPFVYKANTAAWKFCRAVSEGSSRRVGKAPSACGCYLSSLPLISKGSRRCAAVLVADCRCCSYCGQDRAGSLFLKKGRRTHRFPGLFCTVVFFPSQYYQQQ